MRTKSQAPEVGDSTAALLDGSDAGDLTFDDVAGLEEAKEEVAEVVEFLRRPGKFTRLGGTLPKGVLLVGPPGMGKTLMAKAVAGEAGVPFFSISGTDFVEMFVGIGASRVRDLFESAKEKAPCIIFIDEMDAIGRTRGGGLGSGNDERENTLNQLLVEMDGFDSEEGVVIMAATNRPDVLDSALLRPGRFDRQIAIDKPDRIDREKIFCVHVRGLRLDGAVNLARLDRQTPGFAGAEIANVCNEAALLAARKDKEAVQTKDFEQAIDRVIAGLEKKNKLISPEERRVIAYHESGHAIVGWELERTDPIVKVSIVPRGLSALGYAQHLPEERDLYSEDALKDRMTAALGGRVAEKIALGRVTTGAQNDLERVTDLAYAMVVDYGMSDRVGPLSYNRSHRNEDTPLFEKPYSDAMVETIDEGVQGIVEAVRSRAADVLWEKRAQLDEMADALLEKETLGPEALRNILGERPGGESGSAGVAVALDGRTNTPGGAKPSGKEDGSSSESDARNPSSETMGKPAP
jgi:cell division protease FtsH